MLNHSRTSTLVLLLSFACVEVEFEDTAIINYDFSENDTSSIDTANSNSSNIDTSYSYIDTSTDSGQTSAEDTASEESSGLLSLFFSSSCSSKKEDTGINIQTAACETLPIETCHTRSDCNIQTAQRNTFTEEDQCWNIEEPEELFCLSIYTGCDDAITYAHAPDSEECWWFPSTCIPRDWVACEYPEQPFCN